MLGDRPIITREIFKLRTVQAGQYIESEAIPLSDVVQEGVFSVEYTIMGSGIAAITYTCCSTKGGTFFAPDVVSPDVAGSIKVGITEGVGGIAFFPDLYPFMTFRITETGNEDPIVATLKLNVQ